MKTDEKDPAKRILALEAKIQRQRSELKSKQLRKIDLENRCQFFSREWRRLKGGEECVALVTLRAALNEALCWVPDGSGSSAESKGAKCSTVGEMREMARKALSK